MICLLASCRNQVPSGRVSTEATWLGTADEEAVRCESKEQEAALSFASVSFSSVSDASVQTHVCA